MPNNELACQRNRFAFFINKHSGFVQVGGLLFPPAGIYLAAIRFPSSDIRMVLNERTLQAPHSNNSFRCIGNERLHLNHIPQVLENQRRGFK